MRMNHLTRLTVYTLLLICMMIGCSNQEKEKSQHLDTLTFDDISDLETTTIGNNSDVINAVSSLPGGKLPHTVEISSNTLIVDYDLTSYNQENEEDANYWYDNENQEKAAQLNSAILFSLIPNLDEVEMTFKGESDKAYTVTRAELTKSLNVELDSWGEETFKKIKKEIM
jgi:Domain of unknown function (DUF4825)